MLVITSKKTNSMVIMTWALNQPLPPTPPQKKKNPEQNDHCFFIFLNKCITIFNRKLHLCCLLLYLFAIPNIFLDCCHLEAYAREQTQIVQKIVAEHNGSDFVFAEDPEAKKELWKVVVNYLMFREWHFVISLSSC